VSYHIANRHVVHKHKLDLYDERGNVSPFIKLRLPYDAKIVLFETQGPDFMVWEVHSIDFPKGSSERTFWLAGTGQTMPGWLLIMEHKGSFQRDGFVWHLFEVSDQRNNMGENDNG
jgi:hypothetical protein